VNAGVEGSFRATVMGGEGSGTFDFIYYVKVNRQPRRNWRSSCNAVYSHGSPGGICFQYFVTFIGLSSCEGEGVIVLPEARSCRREHDLYVYLARLEIIISCNHYVACNGECVMLGLRGVRAERLNKSRTIVTHNGE